MNDTPVVGEAVPPTVEIGGDNWMFSRPYFLALNRRYGPFTLDGASDVSGFNAQVAHSYCSPDDPFEQRDLAGHNIWLNPPYSQVEKFLHHYLRSKAKDPSIRGVFILPKWPNQPWWKLVRNFRLVEELPVGSHLFKCVAPHLPEGRTAVGPTRWPVQVLVDDGPTIKFMPKQLQTEEQHVWHAVEVIVADKNSILLERTTGDTMLKLSLLASSRLQNDESPVGAACRVLRDRLQTATITEDIIKLLGVERTRGRSVYVHHLPYVPEQFDSNRLQLLTWEQLLYARRHEQLPDGTPVQLPKFGKNMEKYMAEMVGDHITTLQLCSVHNGKQLLTAKGRIDGTACRILIDSGASRNFISHAWTQRAGAKLHKGERFRIRMADGTKSCSASHFNGVLQIDDYQHQLSAIATDLAQWDVILGMPWLRQLNPDIDWNVGTVKDRHTGSILFGTDLYTTPVQIQHVEAKRMVKDLRERNAICFLTTLSQVEQSLAAVTTDFGKEYTDQLTDNLRQFEDIIAEPTTLPPSRPWDFDIELESDQPPKQRTYRMSPAELREVQKQLTEMLEKGWIRPSTSSYGAPILFVRKKDGTLRMCVDYRKLNDITKKNRTPLPRIDELLDSLHGATIFSSLDLYKGYYQCRVKEESVHRTAFKVPAFGLFEFRVLPFGLTNAPAVFQTMMNNVLREYIGKFCVVYLDDVLIYSRSPEEHLRHINLIMSAFQQHKLHVNPAKCFWGRKSVDFLGVTVENNTLRMNDGKVKAIQEWPIPTNVRELRGFLGLAGYYRRFIDRFSARTVPLTDLTKATNTFRWSTEAQLAFDDIKRAMTEAPCLTIADTSSTARFTLYTDASGFAVGAVLLQDQGKGLQPVAYHARKMNKHERHYPVHEQELLAVKDAVQAFRCYLHGCAGFTVITDHNSLRWFFTQPELSSRQVRWYQVLAPYQRLMDIVYKKGALNMADALSRRPDLMEAITRLRLSEHLPAQEVEEEEDAMLNAIEFAITVGSDLFDAIKKGYQSDPLYSESQLPRGIVLHADGFYRAHESRIAIPDVPYLRLRLLTELHDSHTAGHPGRERLLHSATRYFWWPRMSRTVASYVTTCSTCQRIKPVNHAPYGMLQPHATPLRPWQHISLDLITDLPCSQGYDSVVVYVDMLTKMMHAEPCNKTITASQLAQLTERTIFRLHGVPEKIISDRDPRFVSDVWQTLFRLLGTKLNISTSYRPQTDGQTERTNRSLEQILRAYVHPLHDDWAEHLSKVEFAYNSHVSAATGMTPFMANYGYDPAVPLTTNFSSPVTTLPDHVERLQRLHQYAVDLVRASHAAQAQLADQKRSTMPDFKLGDYVRVTTKGFTFKQQPSTKLRDRFIGPFKIIEQISPVAFKLQLPPKVRLHPVFHVSRLERFHADTFNRPRGRHPEPMVNDATHEYRVDSIVDVAYASDGCCLLFKVHWAEPYHHSRHDTWEPLVNIAECSALTEFLTSATWLQFSSTADFRRFQRLHPAQIPLAG